MGKIEAGGGGGGWQPGMVGVDRHGFPGEAESAPPLPAWGHDSYSSPSQTVQPAWKALLCKPCLRPLVACHGPGGSACSARLASHSRFVHSQCLEGSRVFLLSLSTSTCLELCLHPAQPSCRQPSTCVHSCARVSQGAGWAVYSAGAHPEAMHAPPYSLDRSTADMSTPDLNFLLSPMAFPPALSCPPLMTGCCHAQTFPSLHWLICPLRPFPNE